MFQTEAPPDPVLDAERLLARLDGKLETPERRAAFAAAMPVRDARASLASEGVGIHPEQAFRWAAGDDDARHEGTARLEFGDLLRADRTARRLFDGGSPAAADIAELASRALLTVLGTARETTAWRQAAEEEAARLLEDMASGERAGVARVARAVDRAQRRMAFGAAGGRVVRLLVPHLVRLEGLTRAPIGYISHGWSGPIESEAAVARALAEGAADGRRLVERQAEAADILRHRYYARPGRRRAVAQALDWMVAHPVFTLKDLAASTGFTRAGAGKIVRNLMADAAVAELTGRKSFRFFAVPRLLQE